MPSILLDSRVSGIIVITGVVKTQRLALKYCLLPTSALYLNLFSKISEDTILSGIILQKKVVIDYSSQIYFYHLIYSI